ncbi:MAG: hypothetical protein COZ29_00390 [Candidatus Moranbacteria bacterium CG_4_10_14_3_um_filter_45_9]|nr:MAG: hypothetical protein COZ29_00390 [Candidatus Moranbacteria bacterium CG_4_10_14_3_um_filter_45_9]PJA85806.1 MAG: hypothetical protein CO143_00765 [Candidatus Moranbacteria bacterium CG_4_9_14_3_um_filter_45_14]
MTNVPKVGIIVLNYNGDNCLSSCLSSLDRLTYPNKEIIVVDNGSSDDSFFSAEASFPQFTFVRNGKNEGFAKGMNIGMRLAFLHNADWCMLFNYDAEIDVQALSFLMTVAQKNPRAGLLSPVIYEKGSNHLWFGKGRIEFLRMRATHEKPSSEELASENYRSEFLTGCSLLVKKELALAIGLFDEQFFLYYEDADYSLRSTQAGFENCVVPQARVWHSEESKTSPQKTYFLVYSGLLFFKKHTPFLLQPYMALYVTIRRVKNFLDRVFGRGNTAEEVHRAYKQFFYEH